MKLNKPVRVMVWSCSIVVFIGLLYFSLLLPFWNFLNNELKNADANGPGTSMGPILKSPNPSQSPKTGDPVLSPPPAEGKLNILLLGADAAAGLTDTICVVNIDADAKVIKLISIPRDAYVPYGDSVKKILAEKGYTNTKGLYKINFTSYVGNLIGYEGGKFENKGINFLCDIIETMLGYKIDEYAHINFDGFMEIVDIFGGVNVTAPENIYNNKGELIVQKGLNKMNGKTALFYARARYRYDEFGNPLPSTGDSYRKENQLNLIVEVSKQLVTPDNITKANEILNSLRENLHHSIEVSDISKYTSLALDYASGKYKMETHVIKGVPYFTEDDSLIEYVNILNN